MGRVILVLLLGVGVSAGCRHTPKLSAPERESVYDRANVFFEQTLLVKPADSERVEYRMAPLLVQEVQSTNQLPDIPYAVYFWKTFARAPGRVLEQFNYLWFHPDDDQVKQPQGVRITFDSDGMPMLWEILRDPTGARIFFVSQSLEAAAMTNHPGPLPDRRFWVEQPVAEAPEVVVARIIDDSQTAMGPIVYLEADRHEVRTLICRCMDAQAKEAVGVAEYGVATLDDAAVRWLSQNRSPGIRRWLPGMPPDDLAEWLRFPDD
jgi:hypothetical protein